MPDDQVIVVVERPLNEYMILECDEVRLDRVWSVYEWYSDGTMSICPMGGGNVKRVAKGSMHRFRKIDPWAEIADTWVPGMFIVDVSEDSPALRGFHKRQRWNGFACPVVLEEDVPKLQADWERCVDPKEPDTTYRLRKVGHEWELYRWDEDKPEEECWEVQRLYQVDHLGKSYRCWDIGTHDVCWNDVEHDWITTVTTAKQLPEEYGWLANQGCNGRRMNGVHHPPSIVDCWVLCTCPVCR